jgi:hypothetical protein
LTSQKIGKLQIKTFTHPLYSAASLLTIFELDLTADHMKEFRQAIYLFDNKGGDINAEMLRNTIDAYPD